MISIIIFKFSNFQINHMPGDSLKVNINSGGVDKNTFDAIVIGSGISGGWSAKELCDHGLKTLVLERGKNVVHVKITPLQQRIRGTLSIVVNCL
jgi:hypothetical protein